MVEYTNFSLRMTQAFKDEMYRIAKALGLRPAQFVRMALMEGIHSLASRYGIKVNLVPPEED